MKRVVNDLLSRLGYRVVRDSPLLFRGDDLNHLYRDAPWIRFWLELDESQRQQVLPFLCESRSQLGQDLFALLSLQAPSVERQPYFVDVGASDGVRFSNTWLLERRLGWSGIVAEPARSWHERLRLNRSCSIETRAVFARTGLMMPFLDVSNSAGYPELSSLSTCCANDDRSSLRSRDASSYEVETISLGDLLAAHHAPSYI